MSEASAHSAPPIEPEEPIHPDRSGTILEGRYRVVRRIGAGGMGEVYEGLHELIGRRVAIKCLLPEFATNRQLVERFKREARAAASIGNPHIIEVFDVGDFPDGAPFLVMEFLEGQTLGSAIDKGPLPIGRAVKIALQVCDALGAAHEKGIVHRDLKPDNIFLCPRREGDFVKVLDFGISKMNEQAMGIGLTQTGIAMGTPLYMSPEQAQGLRETDHRTDIWALGVVLQECLTMDVPFSGATYPQLLLAICNNVPNGLRQHRVDAPYELEQIVFQCLDKEPSRRFQSMQQLARALEPFANENAEPMLRPGRPESVRPPGSSKPLPLATVPQPPRKMNPPGDSTNPLGVEESHVRAVNGASDASPPMATDQAIAAVGLSKGSSSKRLAWIGGGVLALVLGGAAVASRMTSSNTSSNLSAEQTSDRVPVAPIEKPAPVPAVEKNEEALTARPQQPGEVRVRIRATPANARIIINDVEFPNPMDAMQARSLSPVRIQITADGYKPMNRVVIFDADQNLDVELSRGGREQRASKAGPTAEKSTASGHSEKSKAGDGLYQGRQGNFTDNW